MNIKGNKKGQLVVCCIILGVVWGVLLIRFGASYLKDLPNKSKIEKVRKELDKTRREFEKLDAENNEAKTVRKNYRSLAAAAWIAAIDGNVETALRRKISRVSEKLHFQLNSIGPARTGRINQEFVYADINIQGAGELEDVIRFLAELAKIQPRLAWRQLDLRPDNRYRRSTGAGSANLAAQFNNVPATRLNFRGTLRVLVYEGKLTPEELKIDRLPEVEDIPDEGAEKLDVQEQDSAVPAGIPAKEEGK
ncbi:MAG: hypothetical protein J6S43_03375 [Lentisphaeria bacterium]|nr:hypothetical protein [Lentisphaeria bacterium]